MTSSGTLVALLFAVAALVTKPEDFRLQSDSKLFLGLALIAFGAAGIFGIITNKTLRYKEPSVDWLRTLTNPPVWDHTTERLAARRTAEARINTIESFREKNRLKVRLLTSALSFEVAAVGLLSAGMITIFV